jgi:transcriptional regulator GlxA family with amidase domain
VANPIEQAARIAGIAERSFKRRFKNATGHGPIDYVQRLRVKEAKRRLERTQARWMRSAERWATKTLPFFAAYSNGSRA